MSRKTRMYLPEVPAHIVQRGNNRQACFICDGDFHYYLDSLREGLKRYQVRLHAYCLMTNHVHWLVTPNDEHGISCLVQHVGRQYVRYFNKTYKRTGTLWKGRHKGSLIDAEHYLLACYRYIELNPVAAKMVVNPGGYLWSSYAYNALGQDNSLITPHEVYLRLHQEKAARVDCYRALFKKPLSRFDKRVVSHGISSNIPTGNERFRKQVAEVIGRRVGNGKAGRPKGASG